MSPADLISLHLRDPQTSWAIGTFGAIAEFHRDADEPVALSTDGAVTARGGIRLQRNGAVRPIAWERPAAGDGWVHGIALCLSTASGAMNGRSTITELGPDSGALNEEDRDAVLFDLGIGAPHCDICVRTSNSGILCSLRAAIGQPLVDTELLAKIPDMSPTRVFISRLGRVEVRTPIPKPDGRTPDGPHTPCAAGPAQAPAYAFGECDATGRRGSGRRDLSGERDPGRTRKTGALRSQPPPGISVSARRVWRPGVLQSEGGYLRLGARSRAPARSIVLFTRAAACAPGRTQAIGADRRIVARADGMA